ncbi:MAG: DNA-3-methyladenine glycosylase I [Pseudomonadota bacterium]
MEDSTLASLPKFSEIHARAAKRKGGAAALEALLPKAKTGAALKRTKDDRYLAEMAACVFRSGFVWRIIEAKWPAFEEVFAGFDPVECAMLSDEDLERIGGDARIVRHAKKILSVRNNAVFVREIREEHGGFGRFVADWPAADFVGLWELLKKRGDRLGGQTGRYFLRFMGKETPMLSGDVVRALIDADVVDKNPTSKKALLAVQDAFNQWAEESGQDRSAISRILACSVDSAD